MHSALLTHFDLVMSASSPASRGRAFCTPRMRAYGMPAREALVASGVWRGRLTLRLVASPVTDTHCASYRAHSSRGPAELSFCKPTTRDDREGAKRAQQRSATTSQRHRLTAALGATGRACRAMLCGSSP